MIGRAGFLSLCFAACALGVPGEPAKAADTDKSLADTLALDPPQWEIGDLEIKLDGFAYAAGFDLEASSDSHAGVTGQSRADIVVQRILDNGMILGARGDVLVYHDNLSGDNYGNNPIERFYLFAQTGFGRIELGENDGAPYGMGVSGPTVDDHVTLENPDTSLFRDPSTGVDFSAFLRQVTPLNTSSNYAKISYITPRLFGIQLGASFTPSPIREPLPGLGNPSNADGRQGDITEVAASYTDYISDVAVEASIAYAEGSLIDTAPGFAGLYDWSFGGALSYKLSGAKITLGGGYRLSNAYTFDIAQVYAGGETSRSHLGLNLEFGSWHIGAEYSTITANGPVDYAMSAYEAGFGYKLNDNLYATLGWEWYDYARNGGAFYNGAKTIAMNAGFLTIGFNL